MTQAEEIKQLKKENAELKEALRNVRDHLLLLQNKQEDSLARLRLDPHLLPRPKEGDRWW